jgi:hypothetical protein
MFPQQVEALIKGVPAAEAKAASAPAPPEPAASPVVSPPVSNAVVPNRRQMVLTIDGQRHEVFVEKLEA